MRKNNAILKTAGAIVFACASLATLTACGNEATYDEKVKIDESYLPSNMDPFIAPEKTELVIEGEYEETLDGSDGSKKQTRAKGVVVKGHAKIIPNHVKSSNNMTL